MNGFPTCNICFNDFDLAERQAVVLSSCGHTFCRSCARKLPNQKCGTCRKFSATFANNWAIQGLVEERLHASTTEAKASLQEQKKKGDGDGDVVTERAALQQELDAALKATQSQQQQLEAQVDTLAGSYTLFRHEIAITSQIAEKLVTDWKATMLQRLEEAKQRNQLAIQATRTAQQERLSALQNMQRVLAATQVTTNAVAARDDHDSTGAAPAAPSTDQLVERSVLRSVRAELNGATGADSCQVIVLSIDAKVNFLTQDDIGVVTTVRRNPFLVSDADQQQSSPNTTTVAAAAAPPSLTFMSPDAVWRRVPRFQYDPDDPLQVGPALRRPRSWTRPPLRLPDYCMPSRDEFPEILSDDDDADHDHPAYI